jgi:type IV fimbrial biogenesis protein FimT
MRKHSGFSIIELMVVLAIVGTLVATGLPAMADWVKNSRRTAGLNDFVATLTAARSEAVKRNARVAACPTDDFDSADAKCSGEKDWAAKGWIIFQDTDNDYDRADDEEIIATGAPMASRTLVGDNHLFAYRPNGRYEADGDSDAETGQYLLCDSRGDAEARFILIPLTGRPQISQTDHNGDKPSDCP